jgi:hypothetical protein
LKQINSASLHVMHLNDYPQATVRPAQRLNRIYPDGVAPLSQILRDLRDSGAGLPVPRAVQP